MNKLEPLFDHDVPWLCYRSNKNLNLVYFSCNKCASTFYDEFYKKLGWREITTRDINWSEDFVLSYIRNPVVRHRKGIVDGICNYFPEMKHVFLDNLEKLKFLANITSIEAHSYSIYRMLGASAEEIHWIPIDTALDHRQETLKILSNHDEDVDQETTQWFLFRPKANESSPEKIELYNQLCSVSMPPEIVRYLDFDICIYNKATTPEPHVIFPELYKTKIQQLVDKGFTQEEAEKVVDVEIFQHTNRQ